MDELISWVYTQQTITKQSFVAAFPSLAYSYEETMWRLEEKGVVKRLFLTFVDNSSQTRRETYSVNRSNLNYGASLHFGDEIGGNPVLGNIASYQNILVVGSNKKANDYYVSDFVEQIKKIDDAGKVHFCILSETIKRKYKNVINIVNRSLKTLFKLKCFYLITSIYLIK